MAASIGRFNQSRALNRRVLIGSQIITAPVSRLKEEIINFPTYEIETSGDLPLENRIIIDGGANDAIRTVFAARVISEMNFSDAVSVNPHYEVLNPINFFRLADAFLEVLQAELESRQKEQARMEEEMKNLRWGVKFPLIGRGFPGFWRIWETS